MTSSSICNLAPGSLKIEVFDGLDSILWLPLIGGCCSCCSCSLKIKILDERIHRRAGCWKTLLAIEHI